MDGFTTWRRRKGVAVRVDWAIQPRWEIALCRISPEGTRYVLETYPEVLIEISCKLKAKYGAGAVLPDSNIFDERVQ